MMRDAYSSQINPNSASSSRYLLPGDGLLLSETTGWASCSLESVEDPINDLDEEESSSYILLGTLSKNDWERIFKGV